MLKEWLLGSVENQVADLTEILEDYRADVLLSETSMWGPMLVMHDESDVRIAIPFVTDCGELRRVREILFEERLELRKSGLAFQESVPVGVVVETPASMLGIRDLALEADFLMLNLDDYFWSLIEQWTQQRTFWPSMATGTGGWFYFLTTTMRRVWAHRAPAKPAITKTSLLR